MAAMASVCRAGGSVCASSSRCAPTPVARSASGLGSVTFFESFPRRFLSQKYHTVPAQFLGKSYKLRAQSPNHQGGEEPEDEQIPEVSPKLPSIPYGLITGLASVGFLETGYLTWAKVTGGSVTCPIGAGCSDVLDSSYAYVFGVPLALIGMVAYGSIAFLSGNRLLARDSSGKEEEVWARWLLLGGTTAMAVASSYFMYILTTKLGGASCAFCVGSALLSLSLLFSTLPGFTYKDVRNIAGLQLAVGATVVVGLSVAFGDANSAFARSGEIDLPPVEPEVVTISTSKEISLAKHLQSIGAKMYGAFWCSHCYEQKQMFGREAMKFVDYVECYPEGYRKGVQLAKACDAANIQGFPTWIIKGQTYSGEQDFEGLAKASGFDLAKLK
ncbi:hypothetical protein Mp_2g11540 [Marchantia polymorpha subsp. ruderalis]|uniref:Vitamin K epoxide reductase domain-containing protein n=1 Tax=Marchantia polymorpha TaxID=3197 RepID=A0A2R6XCI5_MARPO|nr:hypothetical protein MARPO_0023s0120 [Marchantia polymorpha]BBN01953.1 hypothetical protein Mp_2g11540 [Marchantia polymorpha subsp. ruderalis]|eukprot:PTQ43815.1 hypothetical protein MARPO_0023s0120 [Marchantia polymorpha]